MRDTLGQSDFADGDLWTTEIPGNVFSLSFVSKQRVPVVVCVDFISVSSSQSVLTSKAVTSADGKPRWVPLSGTDPDYSYGKPIAIVWFLKADGTKTNCTGFAITVTEVITNYHCLSASKQLKNAEIGFSYESGALQYMSRKATRFATPPAKDLDYSVLELDSPVTNDFVTTIRSRPVSTTENLMLIQHPGGLKKMIVTDGCVAPPLAPPVTPIAGTDYFHKCDSAGGSSGSPILDSKGLVVGLHHLEQYDDNSNSYVNLGVYISKIIDDLNATASGRAIVANIKLAP